MFYFDRIEADLFGFKIPLPKFGQDAGYVEIQVCLWGVVNGNYDPFSGTNPVFLANFFTFDCLLTAGLRNKFQLKRLVELQRQSLHMIS